MNIRNERPWRHVVEEIHEPLADFHIGRSTTRIIHNGSANQTEIGVRLCTRRIRSCCNRTWHSTTQCLCSCIVDHNVCSRRCEIANGKRSTLNWIPVCSICRTNNVIGRRSTGIRPWIGTQTKGEALQNLWRRTLHLQPFSTKHSNSSQNCCTSYYPKINGSIVIIG